jgi:two-component system NtrC family sensor kinase
LQGPQGIQVKILSEDIWLQFVVIWKLGMVSTLHKYIINTLAGKLIIAIGLLIIIGGGLSWYILLDTGKKNLTSDAIKYTSSYSDLIKKSTYYSMLTFHRESIQQTIDRVGSAENIKRVRIFDRKGRTVYSSDHKEIGHLVNRASPACIGCHSNPDKPSGSLKTENQWIIYTGKELYRILTFVDPIYNEPSCYTAACHVHQQEQRVLGILETDFSLFSVDENIQEQTIEITIYAIVFMSISSIILYFVLRRFVLKPVSTLSNAMEKVSEGDLDQTALISSRDEMGHLASTFNVMREDLKTAREKMKDWTTTLEYEVEKKTRELKASQDKLIQAEKLASLGRLTADVAHEIRNPLSSIGGFARRLSKVACDEKEKGYADIIRCEVDRLEKILRDVLAFSREARFHMDKYDIEYVINDILPVFDDMCKEQNIDVEIRINKNVPPILIDIEQVRRAIGNLITNAIDSMPGGGRLTITTGLVDMYNVTYVFLSVSDTGQGIPEEKLPLIFEPFFSTKEIGHGTGLGLSITRKIIEEHGGFIKAESIVAKGSTFSLYFPYQSDEESLKVKCWEYMKCGRDKDSTIRCPAYPHFGRVCWTVAGTFCEAKVQGTFAQKYEDCRKCEFYQKIKTKEI